MLVSGYFRLPKDIPKPVWRYPMSYISFHFWALQVGTQGTSGSVIFIINHLFFFWPPKDSNLELILEEISLLNSLLRPVSRGVCAFL